MFLCFVFIFRVLKIAWYLSDGELGFETVRGYPGIS
jgi:hypothetical protein